MKKVVCIQRVLPEYRKPFFKELSGRFELIILYGEGATSGAQKNAEDVSDLPAIKCKSMRWHFRTKDMDYYVSLFPGLFLSLIRESPDVILTEGTTNLLNNFFVYLYSFIFRVPVVWWDAGRDINQRPGKIRRLAEFILAFFQKKSGAILSYTEGGRAYFIGNGVGEENVFVIDNFSPVDIGHNLEARVADLKKYLSVTDDKNVFLCVGALERRKLIAEFIFAASKSEILINSSVFVFVGEGPERKKLEELARNFGLNCIFVGAVYEGKDAYYSLADALVLPGWSTLAIVEALTFNKPAFVPQFGGPEHIFVSEGVTGMKHDKNNMDQLVSNLEMFIGGLFSPDFSSGEKVLLDGVKNMADKAEMAIKSCMACSDAK